MSWASDGCETDAGGLLRRMRDAYACDKWFEDEKNTAHLTFSEDLWKKNGLIVGPDVADLRERCLYLHHDTPFAGHSGGDLTMHLMQQTYWWPGLEKHVRQYVSTCDFCQRNKASNEKPAGLLQPLPVPDFR